MQAIKDKLSDMSTMRKAKAEAKEEEKAEKELAKTRIEVAHEVRLAREAEAAMDLHVSKAADKVVRHEAKHGPNNANKPGHGVAGSDDPYCSNLSHTSDPGAHGGGSTGYSGHNVSHIGSTNSAPGSQIPKSM